MDWGANSEVSEVMPNERNKAPVSWGCQIAIMYLSTSDQNYLECHRLLNPLWATRLTRFLQAIQSSDFLHISFNFSSVHPLLRPITVLLAFLVILSLQPYPVRWCLPGFLSLSPLVQNIRASSSILHTE